MGLRELVEQALEAERDLNGGTVSGEVWGDQTLEELREEDAPYSLRYITERASSDFRKTAAEYVRILGATLYNKYKKTEVWKAAKEDAIELHRVLNFPELKEQLRHDLGYSKLRMWYTDSPRRWCINHPVEAVVIGLWGGAILSCLYDYVR